MIMLLLCSSMMAPTALPSIPDLRGAPPLCDLSMTSQGEFFLLACVRGCHIIRPVKSFVCLTACDEGLYQNGLDVP